VNGPRVTDPVGALEGQTHAHGLRFLLLLLHRNVDGPVHVSIHVAIHIHRHLNISVYRDLPRRNVSYIVCKGAKGSSVELQAGEMLHASLSM
jgi:hypothetical protein